MTVYLALRKEDKRVTAKAIQWWTNSKYSHCELVVDGVSYSSSAMDKGVRAKIIEMPEDKWDLIPLPWADANKIRQYFIETDHLTYGWTGLIVSQVFNSGHPSSKPFCSNWCGAALGHTAPHIFSPETLGKECLFINSLQPC